MGRGGDDFHSPELQLKEMRRAAKAAGLQEVGEPVCDIDVSGRSMSREGIDKIRGMVEDSAIDVVALSDLSRLGRNLAESLTFIQWLRDRGVAVMSSQERIDDSPEGQFMLGQFLNMAQLYSDQIGRRWKHVIERRAQLGFTAGPPPIGYRIPLDDNGIRVKGAPIEPDPVLAPVVTEVFRQYAAGHPISAITRRLASARGKPTAVGVVKSMLLNPVYAGKVVLWNRGKSRPPLTVHDVPALLQDGKHLPLVDADTFARCRERTLRDSKTPSRTLAMSYSLSGLVFCAHCGYRVQKWTNASSERDVDAEGKPIPRLQCRSARGAAREGINCPGIGRPRLHDVEQLVLDRLRKRLSLLHGDDAERAADMARRSRERTDADALIAKRVEVRRQLDVLIRKLVASTSPAAIDSYQRLQADLEAQDASLAERIEQLAPVSPSGHELTFETFASLGETVLSLWPDATGDERNLMLRSVVRRVEIRHADRWREPVADRVTITFL
jgi:DNA invertase Pin-like site-specific DNA recombinase